MSRPDGRIEAGQRLSRAISARAWNRAQTAADMVLGGMVPPGIADPVGVRVSPSVQILVQNTTTGEAPRFGCLSIAGVAIVPSGATAAATLTFASTPVLRGGLPTAGKAFVVPLEPIPASGIGRAAIAGAVAIKLEIVDPDHAWATAKDGSLTGLKSASSGEAEVLWKDSGTGPDKWAMVRFGGAAAGGSRLGKFTGTWAKGATAAVTQWKGDGSSAVTGPTFSVVNRWQTVTGPTGGAWCLANIVDQTWTLAATECV